MEIVASLAALSTALDIAKKIREATGTLNEAEVKLQMAELMGKLADAKLALTDARDALAEKDKEIERLRESFARREDTVEFDGYRYRKKEDGKPLGYPFCPRCLEVEGFPMLLRFNSTVYDGAFCPKCKTIYSGVKYFD